MKTFFALVSLFLVPLATAQDLPMPKDPPASTLNSNPPTLYSQWVTFGKYWHAKAQGGSGVVFSGIDVIKVTLTAERTELKLEWDYTTQGQAGFIVERSTDGATFTTLATLADPAARLYIDKGLAVGSYWYRVRAYKPALISPASNVAQGSLP